MSALKTTVKAALGLLALSTAALLALHSWRPGMVQYEALAAPAAAAPEGVTATWFGVTAVLLRDGEQAIFIDPFFTRPEGLLKLALNRPIAPDERVIAGWLRRAGIDRLDAVLVSHSHFDHAMDAGVVARLTGARLIGSASSAQIGRGAGLPEKQIERIQTGVPLQIGRFRASFIASRHAGATGGRPVGEIAQPLRPPAHYLDYKLGGTYSILVEHERGSLLHHGSAGFEPGALKAYRADVALLGVALIDDLDAYLRETVDAVGARRVLPTHWDDFTRPLDEPLRPFPVGVRLDRFFAGSAQRPELQVQTFSLGQPVLLY